MTHCVKKRSSESDSDSDTDSDIDSGTDFMGEEVDVPSFDLAVIVTWFRFSF